MKAAMHNALVWFTGMPDAWETPSACTGECSQGHACTCETELANDVQPDAERVIRAPIRTLEEESAYQFWKRWSLLIATTCTAALAGLLRLFGAQTL